MDILDSYIERKLQILKSQLKTTYAQYIRYRSAYDSNRISEIEGRMAELTAIRSLMNETSWTNK